MELGDFVCPLAESYKFNSHSFLLKTCPHHLKY